MEARVITKPLLQPHEVDALVQTRSGSTRHTWPVDPDTTHRLQHLGENRDHWVRRWLQRLANWIRNL